MLGTICDELRDIGLAPRIVEFPGFSHSSRAVIFDVEVQNGRHKGAILAIAVSFQEDAYPEYPPHFVHFKSSIDTKFRQHTTHVFEGEKWSAYSLPPSDFWDTLDASERNMGTYYQRHLIRLLGQL